MARLHPEDIEGLEGPTEGERKVFRFLREAARPDQDLIGWYESTIACRPKTVFNAETDAPGGISKIKKWVGSQACFVSIPRYS